LDAHVRGRSHVTHLIVDGPLRDENRVYEPNLVFGESRDEDKVTAETGSFPAVGWLRRVEVIPGIPQGRLQVGGEDFGRESGAACQRGLLFPVNHPW